MRSYRRGGFGPDDLEMIDRAYSVIWKAIASTDLTRDGQLDGERQEALRKLIFACLKQGPVNFDTLCKQVLASYRTSVELPKLRRREPRRSSHRAAS